MSRELKFRAWSEKSWAMYSSENANDQQGDIHTLEQYFTALQTRVALNRYDFKLMQYTGLKDKNGVEIYEGDIIKRDRMPITIVVFYKYGWALKEDALKAIWHQNFCNGALSDGLEVIGNIYQNAELLTHDQD